MQDQRDTAAAFELSSVQQAVWFDDLLHQGIPLYNIGLAWRIDGAIDAALFEQALNLVASAHDALRIVFQAEDGSPRQRVLDCIDVAVALVDFPATEDGELGAVNYLHEAFSRPFDIATDILWDAQLVRVGDTHCYWLQRYHHIINDGFGVAIVVHAVADAYNRLLLDAAPAIAAGPSYLDFLADEQRYFSSDRYRRDREFWRARFAELPEPLFQPKLSLAGQRARGGKVRWTLSRASFNALETFAISHDSTIAQLLVCAMGAYFCRTRRTDEVIVGMPVHNRGTQQFKHTVGMFSSVTAIGVRASHEKTFLDLLQECATELKRTYRHQRFPMSEINRMLNLASGGRKQLFDVSLSVMSFNGDDVFGAAATRVIPLDSGYGIVPLELIMREHHADEAVLIDFNFDSDYFEQDEVERIRSGIDCLLHDAMQRPGAAIGALRIMGEAEHRQVLLDFNQTATPLPYDQLVHRLFEAHALSHPDAIAIIAGERRLCYAELNARANQVAHYLIGLGLRPDARVAICMERGVDLMIGLLGILKAGGAYVPLDPNYPAERLGYMLSDCAPMALLTQDSLQDDLPALNWVHVIVMDDEFGDVAAIARQPDTNPAPPGLTSRHLAYVIYTSGSTGQPKGSLLEHRSLCNLALGQGRTLGVDASSRVLQIASIGFDAATWEWSLALSHGATLILATGDVQRVPEELSALVQEHAVTLALLTPALLPLLDPAAWASVGTLIVGGDACTIQQAQRWSHGRRLINAYGPSEAAVIASMGEFLPGQAILHIGKPVANVQIYVLTLGNTLAPVGIAGELCVGGVGLARGYLNRPELTVEKFIANPFHDPADPDSSARLYRTGDLGRWTSEGDLEFLGRLDHQVKIRGFRIELGEIEAKLGACTGVREAVVLAREDDQGSKRLVAYVTAQAGATLAVAALRSQMEMALPDYMVPSAYVVLEALPLTGNGKLDRKALPAPDLSALSTLAYEAPAGRLEVLVAQVWCDVLQLERVGRHDNFFQLGGHSLMAVQLTSRLRDALGVELALRDLFVHPVLADFAALAGRSLQSTQGAIECVDRSQPLPLSFAQQRLWFIDQLDQSGGAAYHMPAALRLRGTLDGSALRAALDRVVARHENLRTRFIEVDGTPQQCIAGADIGFALAERDLSALHAAEQAVLIDAISEEEAGQGFDLATGPLIRGQLLHLGSDDHLLLITQHHIISDGWSISVLVRELSSLYAAFSQGQPDPLPALSIQYADYALWQRQWLAGEVLERQTAFWKFFLAGAPALLELPADRPRPAVQSYRGDMVPLVLSADLTAALKALGQRHGATLPMTLLAGWGLLLSRLSGQSDVVIGTPVANRPRSEIEGLIGLFVNMLAMRVRTDDTLTVAGLLAQVKASCLEAFEHQDMPFEQAVAALQPVRSLAHSPVFQVSLTVNEDAFSGRDLALPGVALSRHALPQTTAQFDMSLIVSDHDGVLGGELIYACDLFDRERMVRLVAQFESLLAEMVADDQQAVHRLALLSAPERHRVLLEFNRTAAPFPHEQTIHQRFEEQAAGTPEAIAIVAGAQQLSYGELNARANRLAHHLIGLGVRPDTRVAICMARGPELMIGLLGILKAGGAYVPLDPNYPAERLAYMLDDCAPVALLTQASLQDDLPASNRMHTVVLDDDEFGDVSAIARQPASNPTVAGLHARHLAYIMYTSGSTGQPKGVMIEHHSVLRLVINNPFAQITASDCVAHCANIAFDASTWEVWAPLLNGGRVLMIAHATVLDPEQFRATLAEGGASAIFLTTALFNQYAELLAPILSRFRFVLFGGEQADIGPVALVRRLAAPAHLLHVYGPTETTTFASAYEITAIADGATMLPIGGPIGNTTIYLLDPHGQPVPIGVPGELHIGGHGVARGYLNQPALTAARFIDDPFSATAGARMYRTGDLGRWTAQGQIEFLGRNDQQVKIRGFRIELGEIETKLGRYAGLRDLAVILREDRPGEKRLVAYYTLDEAGAAGAVTAELLRSHLGAQLPEYMVPAAYILLDRLPLNANGKLDRRALPVPDDSALANRGYEAPHGRFEQTVAQAWQDLLGVDRVSRHSHFFELGGHSLLAVQLVSRLRNELGVEIALRELLSDPTLAEFAASASRSTQSALSPIEIADRSQALPLSFAQQRLWFITQLDRASGAAYHMPAALRLRGQLDVPALRKALDRIVARHESLRTTFTVVNGVAAQQIASAELGLQLLERDLGQLHGHEQEQLIDAISRDEAGQGFDLATGPLIRGQLLHLGSDDHLLLITQHHIISDGWSISVLVRELSSLYAAFSQGQPDPLPALPVQYADYALWQRQWLAGDVLERQTAFWKFFLSGAPELLELPTDRPRPAVQSYAGDVVPIHVPAALTGKLKALGQGHGVTLFMTLLAAWSMLLSRLSGQADLVIGTPVANRQRSEIDTLIGFFVNTLALRIVLEDDPSVAELLARVKAATLQAFEHQDLPFEQVVEALQPARSMSHSPLFQVMISLEQNPESRELKLPGLAIGVQQPELKSAQFDISLVLVDDGESLSGRLQYATDLFDRATMARIASYLGTVLAEIVEDDARRVSRVALMDARGREQLQAGFNDTQAGSVPDVLVHRLFEQQVVATPHAVALVSADRRLSYTELNTRANRLAHELIALGIEPDARVGIFLERNIDMVVGVLAVLKAGGAYVPLDPAYPAQRLAHMLTDSAPVAVLTQASLVGRIEQAGVALVIADATPAGWHDGAHDAPGNPLPHAIGLGAQHLAYIIYTSGSTGLPKGVALSHGNAVNFITWVKANFAPQQLAHTLFSTSINFDLAVFELYGPLCTGGTVHLVADILAAADTTAPLTLINTVPSGVKALLDRGHWPSSVTTVNVAGEPLKRSLVDRLFSETDVAIVNNLYGPTETTTYSTWVSMSKQSGFLPHIGRPVANTKIYILDAHGQSVPIGVIGEIYIGGAGVARGYLNRPALSAERFSADPFDATPQSRMYRTGDLGRWLADGNIEYRGRNDYQVKIRGFRVELGEIETRLLQCAGVREAVVTTREQAPGDLRLVAYVTLLPAATTSPAALRSQLERHLAGYMVPSAFVMLEALPLTQNGKLDRAALPAPETDALVSRQYQPPEGPIEQAIAQAWQPLLGVERIGRDDHFFEMGGHSLMSVRFLSQTRELFQVELTLRDLFERPVLAQLAEHIVSRQFDEMMGTDMAAMQNELDGLTESELLALLAAEAASDE